ncbi:ribonuclease P/MRP protein subunit POP5 [Pygocentrus nattereri]|uniref:Ribonuclease P/MRP protein subunit POP5 n=1 Tax=Pygocentrus nattereri TaxID=42514 RepID=A0A3B4C8A4_PYGNA|nr:ribonuclease P/MRP protein subunit POP5 [Pygocentrus nattereri]
MVRLKARYLLCEVCVSQRSKLQLLEEKAIFQAVKSAVAKAHGEYGAALFSIGSKVTYLNAYTGVVMLRFRKAFYQLLWSALPFINSIGPQGRKVPCFFNCIYVGGTIKTCQKFLVRYDRQQLYRMLPHCKTGAEKQEVRRAVQTCSHSFYKATQQEDDDDDDDDGGEEGEEEETIVL